MKHSIYHTCEEMNFVKVNKKLIKFAVFLVTVMLVQIVLSFLLGTRMLNLSGVFVKFISKCFTITLSLLINTSILICINTIIKNLLRNNNNELTYLYRDDNGDVTYCGEKFSVARTKVGNDDDNTE